MTKTLILTLSMLFSSYALSFFDNNRFPPKDNHILNTPTNMDKYNKCVWPPCDDEI